VEGWRRHPSNIASNNAGSGRNGVAPSTSTSAAEPGRLVPSPTDPLAILRQMPRRVSGRNRTRGHIVAAGATRVASRLLSERVGHSVTAPQLPTKTLLMCAAIAYECRRSRNRISGNPAAAARRANRSP
jgi:hypothetical protein